MELEVIQKARDKYILVLKRGSLKKDRLAQLVAFNELIKLMPEDQLIKLLKEVGYYEEKADKQSKKSIRHSACKGSKECGGRCSKKIESETKSESRKIN